MVTASLAMLAITLSRTPRHQDLLKVHDGIVVLGVGSAFALFLAFVLLGPVVRRVHPLWVAVLKAYARPATLRTATAFVVLLLIAPVEEAFWRGFVQGRLSQDYGESRAFRLTLAGYVASYLVTLNLALAGAALICGGCWGWFRLRTGSIVPSILSHTLFTLVVYFAYPL
jgi:membrane protease YdiL (CAAX protease family)